MKAHEQRMFVSLFCFTHRYDMPNIQFNFKTGDTVYVCKYVNYRQCSMQYYVPLTVKAFSRFKNINYYRLSDGRVVEECFALDLATYQMLLATEMADPNTR